MTRVRGRAPAKVNLTLHVTGQRDDGYHALDSLVVFADLGDVLTVNAAPDLRLTVSGPFSEGVPDDESNLVLKAAELLRKTHGIGQGAAITLEKHLPNSAGLGGGSSDAAAALRLLAELWQVPVPQPHMPEVLALGADVPVCLSGHRPVRMQGAGEDLSAVPALPDCALVLVNPRVPIGTGAIFAALANKSNAPMQALPEGLDFEGFAEWLAAQRNDLQAPAEKLAPQVGRALAQLRRMPMARVVGMSGSGATCWALVKNMADARHVARAVQVSEMSWWVAPAQIL